MKRNGLCAVCMVILLVLMCGLGQTACATDVPQFDMINGSITIRQDGDMTVFDQWGTQSRSALNSAIIRQSTDTQIASTITVESGNVTLTINDLNIKSSEASILVKDGAKLTLNLLGNSMLKPGIVLYSNAELVIRGNGAVTAQGDIYGGGISGGAITISGGTVTAVRRANGGGICGDGIRGETITISGGTVTATGGIRGERITINGGKVSGVPIGDNNGTVTINDGVVETNIIAPNGTVIISGGTVTGYCISVPDGTVIVNGGEVTTEGGGFVGGTITINGGKMEVTGYDAGISGDGVTINDGIVTATGYDGAGISSDGRTVTINGGTVTATGKDGISGMITINGGEVTATGDDAGIRGWGTTIINDGVVTAIGNNGTGIFEKGGTVTITGGTVNASGYYHAIGDFSYDNQYSCDSIAISDAATVVTGCTSTNPEFTPYHERIDYDRISASAALTGNSAVFPLIASGHSGLSYQWQTSPDNANWTDVEGQTAATASIPISAENDGHYYRCKLTNGWGNVVYTDSARAYVLAFSRQPESVSGYSGDVFLLDAASSCVNVTYQWQRSYDGGGSWADMGGENTSELILCATLSENGALYRCVITATNGDALASDAAHITVESSATTYTTHFYLERVDGSGYDLTDQLVTEAAAGVNVTAVQKTYTGFTENTEKGMLSGTVRADNSLILSRYYDRNSYTITYETNGGAVLSADSAKYGATLKLPTPSRVGYAFAGWYQDEALTQVYTATAMGGEDLTLYAKWELVSAERSIEYRINGITLRNSSYQSIDAIPRSTFYTEVSVTNLSSQSMDTVILAAYDKDGKMLSLSFLYANPQIGQTFVLGTSIDNSGGEIAKLKAFVLPMLGDLTPLAEAVEY